MLALALGVRTAPRRGASAMVHSASTKYKNFWNAKFSTHARLGGKQTDAAVDAKLRSHDLRAEVNERRELEHLICDACDGAPAGLHRVDTRNDTSVSSAPRTDPDSAPRTDPDSAPRTDPESQTMDTAVGEAMPPPETVTRIREIYRVREEQQMKIQAQTEKIAALELEKEDLETKIRGLEETVDGLHTSNMELHMTVDTAREAFKHELGQKIVDKILRILL